MAAVYSIKQMVAEEEFRLFSLSKLFIKFDRDNPLVFEPLTPAALVAKSILRYGHRMYQPASLGELSDYAQLCSIEDGSPPRMPLVRDAMLDSEEPAILTCLADFLRMSYLDNDYFVLQFSVEVQVKTRRRMEVKVST